MLYEVLPSSLLLSNVLWSSLAGSGDGSVYAWNVRSGKVQKDIYHVDIEITSYVISI